MPADARVIDLPGHTLLPGLIDTHTHITSWSPLIDIPGTGQIVDGVDAVRKAVRTTIKYGADHIKVTATGGILSVGDAVNHSQYSDEELRAAVEEAARLGRRVAMHAHGAEGIVAAVRAGAASIEHGSLIDDAGIALMKERGTYLVPTLIILDEIVREGEAKGVPANAIAKARAIEPERRKRLRRAYQAGVKFAFGTDATSDIHGRNAQEFPLLVEQLGATPMEAILMATRNAADLMGIAADAGSVTAGKWADIVAVEGNPLEDVTRLQRMAFVMKAGQVVHSTGTR